MSSTNLPPELQSNAPSAELLPINPRPTRPGAFALTAALLVALLIWPANYIVGKITLTHLDALTLASFRFQLAAAILLVIYFSSGKRRRPLRRRDIWPIFYLGFFGFAINQGCFVLGLSRTTSQHSVIIISIEPILILLFAAALKLERLTAAKIVGMAISFCGALLLESDQASAMHSPLLVGDLISLAGVIGFSIYTVLGKRIASAYDSISLNTFSMSVAAILFLPLAVRQGIRLDWQAVGWAGWAGLVYMAALSSVTGYVLFYWLLKHMEASRVVVVNYFQPAVVFLLSIPILGERPGGRLLASAALVLLGVYLTERVGG